MKNIIALIVIALSFSFSMNAQNSQKTETTNQVTTKISPEKAAENDAEAITKFLGFNEEQKQAFKGLFIMKHELLQDKNTSIEKKKQFCKIVESKIAASMDGNQLEKLKSNTALYRQLTEASIL